MEVIIDRGQHRHHGVVTNVCLAKNTFEIVHLAHDPDIKGVTDCQKMNIALDGHKLHYCKYTGFIIDRHIVKLRAEILYEILNDIDNDAIKINCDHFASYCAAGFAYSKQLQVHNEAATIVLDTKYVFVYQCNCRLMFMFCIRRFIA